MSLLVIFFLIFGVFFILLSVIGLIKMKDLMLRVQVASKASTLGLISILIAVVLSDPNPNVIAKTGLTILFLFLTAPVAAQAIAKVGHLKASDKLRLESDDLAEDLRK